MISKEMLGRAERVLDKNLYPVEMNDTEFRRTVPSRQYYTHQWNWDSVTHSMGLVHTDSRRATDELISLTAGQWENGLIPHMIFNSRVERYFPSPSFWGTEAFANGEIVTSGITQPPLLGMGLSYVAQTLSENGNSGEAVTTIADSVLRYHKFLKKYRDPEDSGLISVLHPWEAGTDDSPRWDRVLDGIAPSDIPDGIKKDVDLYRSDVKKVGNPQRPDQTFYYRCMYLVDLFKQWGWDPEKMTKSSPFNVKDVLFNSVWARSNETMADLLDEMGRSNEADLCRSWARQTTLALMDTWSDTHRQFCDIQVQKGSKVPIVQPTNSMFAPLMTGAVPDRILSPLIDRLTDTDEFWSEYPVPTTAMNAPLFDKQRYWRGPSWPITNLFIIEGLDRYQADGRLQGIKKSLIESTLAMIAKHGFSEYYDPVEGDKLGFGDFSWSAAIYIYLSHRYESELTVPAAA